MHLEIPMFTRCCCCVPVRLGIIILAYLELAMAIIDILLALEYYPSYEFHEWLDLNLVCIDAVCTVLLLVGAHKEISKLMRMYYYYGFATIVMIVVMAIWYLMRIHGYLLSFEDKYNYTTGILSYLFVNIVMRAYLMLMIRSQLLKPQKPLNFDNHLAEICVQPRETHVAENASFEANT